jgi:hypothetical protein
MNAPKYSYEIRQALPIMRAAIKKHPELAAELMKDASKEAAHALLLRARDELNQLLSVSQACTEAARVLAEKFKDQPTKKD